MATTLSVASKTLPEPLKLLTEQGGEIVSEFEAPNDMTGYVADLRGQVVTLYVAKDGQYMFTGAMLDAEGNNMGQLATQAYINGPKSEKVWKALTAANWIADGRDDAKNIIYTFTDPNCPYCKKLWKAARPWVDSGDVQIRHILVGILRADSLGKADALLAADDPASLLFRHEAGTLSESLAPLTAISKDVSQKLQENYQLMVQFGISATPATFYRDKNGVVKTQMGLPPSSSMPDIMGDRAD